LKMDFEDAPAWLRSNQTTGRVHPRSHGGDLVRKRRIILVGLAQRTPCPAARALRPRWVKVPTNLRCPAHLQHLPGDFAASPWTQCSTSLVKKATEWGRSPLTRGRPIHRRPWGARRRSIPAHAGETAQSVLLHSLFGYTQRRPSPWAKPGWTGPDTRR